MKTQGIQAAADSKVGAQLVRLANSKAHSNARHSNSRLEVAWAWASLLILVICWDAALRLDQRVSVPRVRIAHAAETQ